MRSLRRAASREARKRADQDLADLGMPRWQRRQELNRLRAINVRRVRYADRGLVPPEDR